jgi:hypothetical protein
MQLVRWGCRGAPRRGLARRACTFWLDKGAGNSPLYGLAYRVRGHLPGAHPSTQDRVINEDEHYLAVDEQITLDRVLFAFRKYLGRDPSWRTDFRWEKLDL